MSHTALRVIAALLSAPALLLAAGCSGQGGKSVAAPSPQTTASTTDTPPITGRTLTEAQLLSAGLTISEMPQHFDFVPVPDGHWSPATPDTTMPTAKPGCQPLVDLIFGTVKASAEVSVGYQANGVDVGTIKLASYAPGEANAFFGSVRRALQECSDIAFTSFEGPNDGMFKLLPVPGLGDDSLSFVMIRGGGDTPVMDGFDYVRVGADTTLVTLIGLQATPPPLSHSLLAAQVSKLRSAQN